MKPIEILIEENKAFIYSISYYFVYPDKEDLYQVGCIGMIKAYNKYDETRNTKFTSFAHPYIFAEMRDYISKDKPLKISYDMIKLGLKIEKVKVLLSQNLMREPSTKEIAMYLNLKEEQVINSLSYNREFISLDDDSGNLSLHEIIGKDDNIEELINLKQSLESLDEEDRLIILQRYYNDYTQQETAKQIGMSQVQVSRREKKVLTLLKQRMTN